MALSPLKKLRRLDRIYLLLTIVALVAMGVSVWLLASRFEPK
jgi:hypothetical protein